MDDNPKYIPILEEFCKKYRLVNMQSLGEDDIFEISFYVILKKKQDSSQLIKELNKVPEIKEMFYHIKYEDIVHYPKKTFAGICNFIGIEPFKKMGEIAHNKSLEKWKTDPDFNLQLDDSVIQMAVKFGYSEEELINPVNPNSIPSRQLNKKWFSRFKRFLNHFKDRRIKPLIIKRKF